MKGAMPETEAEKEFAKLQRSRTVAKGWVTRLSNRLISVLSESETTEIEIYDLISQLEIQISKYDETDLQYLGLVPEANLGQELQASEDFKYESRKSIVAAKKKLQEARTLPPAPAPSEVSDSARHVSVKLPKLELPHFSGKYTEWETFWQHFEIVIHSNDEVPKITKFNYLNSLLEGEAIEEIRGYSLTEANYDIAVQALKDRYGKPDKIVFAHVQALLNIKKTPLLKGPKYVEQLWHLQSELLSHIRSLKALEVTEELCQIFLTPIIFSQLPNDMRL